MASNAKNVYAAEPGATGALFVAPLGTPGPTSATSVLDADFIDLGHIGEDGFTETIDRSIDYKKNFGGLDVKSLQTDYSHTIKFVLLESINADVLKAVYGSENVTITAANGVHGTQYVVKKNALRRKHRTWVIDTVDTGLDAFYRSFVPDGQIVSVGDVMVVHTDVISYEVELKCFADESNNFVYTYIDNGVLGS